MSEQSVACEQYATYPDVVLSDHKPVAALLKVPVRRSFPPFRRTRRTLTRSPFCRSTPFSPTSGQRFRNKLLLSVRRSLPPLSLIAQLNSPFKVDSHDNDALPDVKLSPGPSVEIDKVRYNEPISATIELVNVGEVRVFPSLCSVVRRAHATSPQVMAPWSFVYKPGSTSLTPPWLQISPLSGLILPNERVSITLTIHVMASSAGRLNFPLTSTTVDDSGISDLLIISIEKKDLFLSVAAREWIPTVFGSSVECLVRLHEPIRSLSIEKRQRIADAAAGVSSEDGTEEVGRVSVPFALHRLVNFLAEHALGVPDLFAVAGESELVKLVRECVDTVGSSSSSCSFLADLFSSRRATTSPSTAFSLRPSMKTPSLLTLRPTRSTSSMPSTLSNNSN